MPNQHYFMMPEPDWQAPDNPFIQAGFYTDGGCMRDTQSPSFGVEEWIYRFWHRRAEQGNLEPVEQILLHFIAIWDQMHEGASG